MQENFIEPTVPSLLLLYNLLHRRKVLSPIEKNRHERLVKGYIGEKTFGQLLHEEQSINVLPLFGLLLEAGDTECQIDSLLLTNGVIFLIEIKNNEGDYYVQEDKILSLRTKKEIKDPFMQSERAKFLLKSVLTSIGIDMEVRNYVVFPNDQFMLYKAPLHLPMVLPTQVRRFLRRVSANAGRLDERHEKLAQKLASLHKEKSFYERVPSFELDEMRRGVFCFGCAGELRRDGRFFFRCAECHEKFHIDEVLLFATAEFHMLFPAKNITPDVINDWCGKQLHRQTIRKVLQQHFNYVPNGRYSYYVFKSNHVAKDLLIEKLFRK